MKKPLSLYQVAELLEELEQNTGEPGDLDNTLWHIGQTAKTFFTADEALAFAISPVSNHLIASQSTASVERIAYEASALEELARETFSKGMLQVEDLEKQQRYKALFVQLKDIRSFVVLALHGQQKSLGVLCLFFKDERRFSPEEREWLSIIAGQAAFILHETWLLYRFQEVAHIGQEINQELDTVESLFERLIKRVANILNISHTLLLGVYQPQTDRVDMYLYEEGKFITASHNPFSGACRYTMDSKDLVMINEWGKERQSLPFNLVHIPGTKKKEALIFVPLMLRDTPLGVISIQHPLPRIYNREDLSILQLLANNIALALHNIQLHGNLFRLNEAGQHLTRQLDSEQVLQAIVDHIQDATKADIVILYPYNSMLQNFNFPPKIAGQLLDSTIYTMHPGLSDDIAALMLSHETPIFARETITLYYKLRGENAKRHGRFEQREKVHSTAAILLQAGEEAVGVLFVNFRQSQRFDATQKLLIMGLAHYAAIAINNSRLYGTLSERRVSELTSLRNIDSALNRSLELKPTLDTILHLAQEQVRADDIAILLHNAQDQTLETLAAVGRNVEKSLLQTISLQDTKGITRWVFGHKKPVRLNNIHAVPRWSNIHLPVANDIVSELDVPLLDDDEVIGVLNFESVKEAAFTEEDQHFLLTLAGQAVLAIKKAQAYEREKHFTREAERAAERFGLLYRAGKELSKITDLAQIEQAYAIVLRLVEQHSKCLVIIRRYDEDSQQFIPIVDSQQDNIPEFKRISIDEDINGQVAQVQHTIMISEANDPPAIAPHESISIKPAVHILRSRLVTPIGFENRYYGNLALGHREAGYFNDTDKHFIEGLADQLAITIYRLEIAKARQDLEQMSSMGESAFEVTHRLGNDLGLINLYISHIQNALDKLGVKNSLIDKKLNDIDQSVKSVLAFSRNIKADLATQVSPEEAAGEMIMIQPKALLEEAWRQAASSAPPTLQINILSESNVAAVRVFHHLIVDTLHNLIVNAIQALPDGKGKITLKAHNLGRSVALEVTDTGEGIPPEKLKKIFGQFFSTKKSSGFGLWYAKRNALKNNGTLKVESRLGEGTTFTLLLPRTDGGTL